MAILTRRTLVGCSLGGLLLGSETRAQSAAQEPLPQPSGKPILTISGRITRHNADDKVSLDRATLESLGEDGFQTNTPWYTGPTRFDGVRMTRLMEAVGCAGNTVRAVALNDYTTDIPVSDFAKFSVLLAIKRNGDYMPVRDKGPLFIVYPFDRFPELQTHQFYSRAAWQVTQLVVS